MKEAPFECKELGGYKFPLELSNECILEAINFVPRPDDVGIVTYPRSGTTWIQQVVLRLLNYGKFTGSWRDMYTKGPCLELQGTKEIINSPEPISYKTHIPYHPSRFNPKSKYIWVVRNPKDVCVSSYHLYADLNRVPWRKCLSFEQYVQHFCCANVYYGGYWEHLRSWWQVKDEPNVLMVVYEKMKQDQHGTIRRIGEFLGGEAAKLVQDDEIVESLIVATSVRETKKQANSNFLLSLFRFNKLDISITKEIFRLRNAWTSLLGGEVNFVRKGEVGDWKNHFTPQTEEMFENWIFAQPEGKEVMFLFE